jgi:hypothetical protein
MHKRGLGRAEQARRALIVGLGENALTYVLGHGDLYFDAWTEMTEGEQTAATERGLGLCFSLSPKRERMLQPHGLSAATLTVQRRREAEVKTIYLV